MMMKRVKYSVPGFFFFFLNYPYTPCYIISDETGTQSAAGESRTDYQATIKWWHLCIRLLSTLRYILNVTFQYPENYNIQQQSDSSSAGYHNFYLIFCSSLLFDSLSLRPLTLILRRSHTGTVWFYTSTSHKRAARPKLYTKSLTRDLKLMYSRLTLVRISINL